MVYRCHDLETLDKDTKQPVTVAVKLLRAKAAFKAELASRDHGFSPDHVMPVLLYYPGYDRLPLTVQLPADDVDRTGGGGGRGGAEAEGEGDVEESWEPAFVDDLAPVPEGGAGLGQADASEADAEAEEAASAVDPLASWPDTIALDPPDRADKNRAEHMFTLALPWADVDLAGAIRHSGCGGGRHDPEVRLVFRHVVEAVLEVRESTGGGGARLGG